MIDKKKQDIIYFWSLGNCGDVYMGISKDSLLNWEVFELLFYFPYFPYIFKIHLYVIKS